MHLNHSFYRQVRVWNSDELHHSDTSRAQEAASSKTGLSHRGFSISLMMVGPFPILEKPERNKWRSSLRDFFFLRLAYTMYSWLPLNLERTSGWLCSRSYLGRANDYRHGPACSAVPFLSKVPMKSYNMMLEEHNDFRGTRGLLQSERALKGAVYCAWLQ